MKKRHLFLSLLGAGMMCTSASAFAIPVATGAPVVTSANQQDDIKGLVFDATGEPVIGAAVRVVGGSEGTVTNLDGEFTINVAPGTMLEITYIGCKPQTVKAVNGMKVTLKDDTKVLDEVVVTALGIKRDRKALGYGIEEVKGEELTKAKETNVVNSLAGKVAGLVVQQTAGGASGSTRVQLRGATEMTGNNQPLYVIDGVPLDNTNFASAGGEGGYDLGDGISAINPDDIETMSVLKGPAAAALYGSRASHGVILITTKKANDKEKFSVEYNGNLTFDVQAASWDNLQQTYGQGQKGMYINSGREATNMSWGPKADNYSHYYEFDGQNHPYSIVPNNSNGFFRTGLTAQNSAIISAHSGKTGMRFSFTDMRNKDILPNSHMSRDNFNLRVNTSLGQVDLDFTANYTHEAVKNRPALASASNNVGKNLMTLATTFDQAWLKHYQNADGTYADWNGMQVYNVNPYWDLYANDNNSTKDVFRFTGKAVYNINKQLKVQGTIGTDINNMDFSDYIKYTSPQEQNGKMTSQKYNNRTINAELLAIYHNRWGDFDFTGTGGGNIYRVDNKTTIVTSKDQIFKDIQNIGNYNTIGAQDTQYKKQINSLFASGSLGYKSTYFMDVTVRGDQSSTLPVNNNIYVYPSLSGSVVWSEYLQPSFKKWITYGKLRASVAEVGSDTDPYMLQTYYKNTQYSYSGANQMLISSDVVPNPDLKPTRTRSFEVGLETKLLNNRMNIDLTYYNQTSRDQIIRLASSSASGYSSSLVNAGKIRNSGFELVVGGRAIQTKDFAWDLGMNFSKNWNKVIELTDNMDYFEIESAPWMGVSVGAEVGENFGSIKGRDFKRDANGNVLINASTGLPIYETDVKTIGNASWDWTGGFYTTFTYKGFRLSAAFDVKVGADVFSMSMSDACYTGKAAETVEGRDLWYNSEEQRVLAGVSKVEDWVNSGRAQGYVAQGMAATVDEQTGAITELGVANSRPVNPEDYWNSVRENAASLFVYDNSYVKCREITFGYTFPEKMLGKVVKGLTVSFVARNPFTVWKNIPNIDPDAQYNSQGMGLEYGSLPSRRSYGLNVNLKF